MMYFLKLRDLRVQNKVVLVRVDYNVPMDGGHVTDTTRIERSLPTLRDLATSGARIVLLSHLGRPDGKPDPKYSLRPVAAALEAIWGDPVAFAENCVGPVAKAAVNKLQPGEILLLENTRFHPGEEKNDPELARQMAGLGDLFVNDAFSAAHRAHASTTGIGMILPAAAGHLMQEELEALSKALEKPVRPVMAIVGGAKISTKLDVLRNLMAKVNVLVPGGGMANTFLVAKGFSVGTSLVEPNMVETAQAILADAAKHSCRIILPRDAVVAERLAPGITPQTVVFGNEAVPDGHMILDLGPLTAGDIKDALSVCRTVVWNGPLGVFETPPFDAATNDVARAVASLTDGGGLLSVAGGGDTVAALSHAGVTKDFSYVSTAGGAFLEWLEGKELPGVAVLMRTAEKLKTGEIKLGEK